MAKVANRPRARSGTSLGLPAELLVQMHRSMLQARLVDERCWLLNRGGQAPFIIGGQGQEAAGVGTVYAMDRSQDWFIPYYRDLAVVLALGMTPEDIFNSVLGKAADPNSGARQMPSHFGSRRLRIVSQGSSVGTQYLHGVGTALASKIRGDSSISIAYVGEGGTSQGDWHEALNFASVHQLPIVFVVENNQYAISVPAALQMRVHDVAERAAGYGMPGVVVDGQDPIAVYHATKAAADRARAGGGPTVIEAKTHRLTSHSSDDDQRAYRDPEELQEDRADDCVPRFSKVLRDAGIMTDEEEAAIRSDLMAEIDHATEAAETGALPDPESTLTHVYGDAGPSGEELSGWPRVKFGEDA